VLDASINREEEQITMLPSNLFCIYLFLLIVLYVTNPSLAILPPKSIHSALIRSSKSHHFSNNFHQSVENIDAKEKKSDKLEQILLIKGGKTSGLKYIMIRNLLGVWGVLQVSTLIGNAVYRLIPVALQPFQKNDLQPYQWGLYLAFCSFMGYFQGYKGFQKKFAPLVVSRAFNLYNNLSILNLLLAGPYSMGMFNASKKRMIASWGLAIGVSALAKFVKYLSYPYKSIVDGGVVFGLSYGTTSLLFCAVGALFGKEYLIEEEKPADSSPEPKKDQ
jgi:hypothetical protein